MSVSKSDTNDKVADELVVVMGAGWLGLPLALELARTHRVVACVRRCSAVIHCTFIQ